ncbi:MAG: MBL fold metallo-hydrolase [bacterium]|nr:MBL fold metallo-hydrolase [bacterium]
MDITYIKDKEFKLTGKNIAIAINPKTKAKTDVILYSESQENNSTETLIFDGPGEYEVKGSMINGIQISQSGKICYSITIDDLKVVYLGDIENSLTDNELDLIGAVDILLISIGDLDPSNISKIIGQIEPRVVIPMNYTPEKLKSFESEVGTTPSPVEKFKIIKKDLNTDTQQIIILKS